MTEKTELSPQEKAAATRAANAEKKKQEAQQASKNADSGPQSSGGSSLAQAIKDAMHARRVKASESREARRMTPEHLAKVAEGRIKLAKKRGSVKAMNHAIALNAKDAGLSDAEYRKEFGS